MALDSNGNRRNPVLTGHGSALPAPAVVRAPQTGCDLVLECTISAAAVARGFTSYFAVLLGFGSDALRIPCGGLMLDLPAAIIVGLETALLCYGIRESSNFNIVINIINLCCILFVLIVGESLCAAAQTRTIDLESSLQPRSDAESLRRSHSVKCRYPAHELKPVTIAPVALQAFPRLKRRTTPHSSPTAPRASSLGLPLCSSPLSGSIRSRLQPRRRSGRSATCP